MWVFDWKAIFKKAGESIRDFTHTAQNVSILTTFLIQLRKWMEVNESFLIKNVLKSYQKSLVTGFRGLISTTQSLPSSGIMKRIRRVKGRKPEGWDKENSIGKVKVTHMSKATQGMKLLSQGQAGVQPSPGKGESVTCYIDLGRQTPSLWMSSPSTFLLSLYNWAWYPLVWNILWLLWVTWPSCASSQHPMHSQLPHQHGAQNEKKPFLCTSLIQE